VTPEIEALLEKARRSLANARRSSNDGDHDFAVSRAYYAMFCAAGALLLSKGQRLSRHTDMIAALNRDFVRTGELDRAHFDALESAFRARNAADYEIAEPTSPETAARVLRDAKAFIDAAVGKLHQQDPP
jgi:uncharacterized protein (UPF0332 family)